MDEPEAERVARNEAIFRDANERIEAAAEEYAVMRAIPFLCECADPACTELVPLTLADYEGVRSNPGYFLNAVGHEQSAGPHSRVVESRDGWVLVEKIGRAGEVAEELDPRTREPDRG